MFWKRAHSRAKCYLAATAFVFIITASPAFSGEDAVDAVTAASYDATTGASKTLEPVSIDGDFSVAYALNKDGALFILAHDLAEAYHRNELASDSIFKGKVVLVKGTVEKISRPGSPRPWISLGNGDESGLGVRCSLQASEMDNERPEKGSVIQVKGICDGKKLRVSLSDGEIVN